MHGYPYDRELEHRVYRGRFAPSPTGPLHFGSLVSAVGSYLQARTRRGLWLLRIEDLDTPRNAAGAESSILRCLERFGFEWDGALVRQSERLSLYRGAIEELERRQLVFPCCCTRRELADSVVSQSVGPAAGSRYPGNCRDGLPAGRVPRALRVRVDEALICFDDALQGRIRQDVAEAVGDFLLLRADGVIAYQLAVVVDDAAQGVTHVVRGADLLDSTPRQIYLQGLLGYPSPQYMHLPVAANSRGEKLSKQTRAMSLERLRPQAALVAALGFLGQGPPADLEHSAASDIWRWALDNWDVGRLPAARSLPAPAGF